MNTQQKQLMMGDEAVARGAWEAGVAVATAYPGTPATEINEAMAKFPEVNTEWSVNEKVALEVAIGAAFGGARALCSMKHVGMNVAADGLFTLAYSGVNGGLVIVTADDPGCHSSQNEQDNRYYAKFAQVPMLEPSDAQEALDMTKAAFELSEKYDTPVFVRLTTRISHTDCVVELGERVEPPRKPYETDPTKYAMVPPHAFRRHPSVETRERLLEEVSDGSDRSVSSDKSDGSDRSDWNRIEMRSTEFGVVTSGISYQTVREVLPDYSVLKVGMTWPVPRKLIRQFASQVKKLYVVEEGRPFLEDEVHALGIAIEGKEQAFRIGEVFPAELRRRILGVSSVQKAAAADVPRRPPQFCPGCGHRAVFFLLNKNKLIVNGDIGCYGLAALPPYDAMDTLVCMGASIGMDHGMRKIIDPARRSVAIIGDSTFFHSGMTNLANLVHNHGTSTIIILDNRITAMTGHQPNPTTGRAADGAEAPRLDIAEVCRALGVRRIFEIDGYDVAALEERLRAEVVQTGEPSVIIVRERCVIMDRKKSGPPFVVTDKCKLCKACFKLGCPAITIVDNLTAENAKNAENTGKKKQSSAMKSEKRVMILEDLCDGCGVCAAICPLEAIEQKGVTE